ncbi:hypothetical protein I3760_11G144500 [Carya illinoinensis]|nr:hypothetical protein I3760_11G144500 [Carya illinoinensis]
MMNRRKVRMTSSHHAPNALGDTRATMVRTKGRDPARVSNQPQKPVNSNCRLQLACMKSKLLVSHMAMNSFLVLVHTDYYTMGAIHAQSHFLNHKEGDAEGKAND